jgi:amino acid transporter
MMLLRRLGLSAAMLVAGLLFVAIAALALSGAIYLALAQITSPPQAALGAAGAALAIALCFAAAAMIVLRRRRKYDLATDIGALLGREAAILAAAHPRGTIVGSLLLGFAMGADPQLRRALKGLIG